MAIVIENERRKTNWAFIIGVLVVVVSIIITIIYVFFVNPQQAEVIISPKLQSLSDFSQLQFNPEQMMSNPAFKNLQSFVQFNIPQSGSPALGKSNPFIQ